MQVFDGLRVSGFWFLVSSFWFLVSGFVVSRFVVSWFLVSGFGFRVSGQHAQCLIPSPA